MNGDAPAKNRKFTPGELLHGYRLRAVLGDGAFSRVYLAEDPKTHIAYALKHVVSTGEKEDRWVDQMRAEWEIGRKLDHPALRKIVDCKHEGWFLKNSRDVALVLELIDAEPLSDQNRPAMGECIRIFRDVAAALCHMHEKGFVHTDMKPLNILYTDDRRTKVIDLGQAAKVGTAKERIQGTPGYMAPEQAARQPLDPQTDVFNFAATMYSVLLGHRMIGGSRVHLFAPQTAFRTNEAAARVDEARLGPAEPIHRVDPQIPEQLSMLLLDCLEANPNKRKKMTWVLKVLQGLQGQPAQSAVGV